MSYYILGNPYLVACMENDKLKLLDHVKPAVANNLEEDGVYLLQDNGVVFHIRNFTDNDEPITGCLTSEQIKEVRRHYLLRT